MSENISASELVKRSAKQLVYLRIKKEKIHNWMMDRGLAYQSKVVKDESLQNVVAEELRGCYNYIGKHNKDYNIFFCIDMLKNNAFYEIKSVFDTDGNSTTTYNEWYLKQSLAQCAFYKSLIMKMDNTWLSTPKFRLKEGYQRTSVNINRAWPYYLMFGEIGVFEIKVQDPDAIIDFYKNKLESLTDYSTAECFDDAYKWSYFDILSKFFTYEKVENK